MFQKNYINKFRRIQTNNFHTYKLIQSCFIGTSVPLGPTINFQSYFWTLQTCSRKNFWAFGSCNKLRRNLFTFIGPLALLLSLRGTSGTLRYKVSKANRQFFFKISIEPTWCFRKLKIASILFTLFSEQIIWKFLLSLFVFLEEIELKNVKIIKFIFVSCFDIKNSFFIQKTKKCALLLFIYKNH